MSLRFDSAEFGVYGQMCWENYVSKIVASTCLNASLPDQSQLQCKAICFCLGCFQLHMFLAWMARNAWYNLLQALWALEMELICDLVCPGSYRDIFNMGRENCFVSLPEGGYIKQPDVQIGLKRQPVRPWPFSCSCRWGSHEWMLQDSILSLA